VNDDELVPLLEYARGLGAEVRFIEYMDVGGATQWSMDRVTSRRQMLQVLSERFGPIDAVNEVSSAPAERYRLPDGTLFGIIASTTEPFCQRCDRSRLTADGMWFLCLYAARGIDLRGPLREGRSAAELGAVMAGAWEARVDRGAEQRLAERVRAVIPIDSLRRDPHLEMHTRGG
jgi:cyclic pyranopterin phosphate synthase